MRYHHSLDFYFVMILKSITFFEPDPSKAIYFDVHCVG